MDDTLVKDEGMDGIRFKEVAQLWVKGISYPVYKGVNTIGRREVDDIRIIDDEISRPHALLIVRGNNYTLQNVSALSGLTIYGERMRPTEEAELIDGSVFYLSTIEAKFVVGKNETSHIERPSGLLKISENSRLAFEKHKERSYAAIQFNYLKLWQIVKVEWVNGKKSYAADDDFDEVVKSIYEAEPIQPSEYQYEWSDIVYGISLKQAQLIVAGMNETILEPYRQAYNSQQGGSGGVVSRHSTPLVTHQDNESEQDETSELLNRTLNAFRRLSTSGSSNDDDGEPPAKKARGTTGSPLRTDVIQRPVDEARASTHEDRDRLDSVEEEEVDAGLPDLEVSDPPEEERAAADAEPARPAVPDRLGRRHSNSSSEEEEEEEEEVVVRPQDRPPLIETVAEFQDWNGRLRREQQERDTYARQLRFLVVNERTKKRWWAQLLKKLFSVELLKHFHGDKSRINDTVFFDILHEASSDIPEVSDRKQLKEKIRQTLNQMYRHLY